MKRQIVYGSNTVIAIVLFTVILLLINVLPRELKVLSVFGMRVPLQKQWDMTAGKKFSLSDETLKVLTKLDETPVTAIGFAQKGTAGYTNLEEMLQQYAFQTQNFKYSIEDPVQNPDVAKQYGIKSMRTLILQGKTKKETVTLPPAMGANDFQQMESKITAGLLRLTNPKPATVYFTKGHGEFEVDDQSQRGIALFKSSLEGENYVVKSTFLFNEKSKQVPDDATVVVIAGVQKDFMPDEIAMLDKYMEHGGRILCFFNANMDMKSLPNLEKFFSSRGIAPQNDLVLSDQMVSLQTAERVLLPAVTKYGNSPITENFNVPTVFPMTRSFKLEKAPKDATTNALAYTIADSFEIRRPITNQLLAIVIQTQRPDAIYDKSKDGKGEAIVAATGTYAATPVGLTDTSPAGEASPSVANASPQAAASPAAAGATPAPTAEAKATPPAGVKTPHIPPNATPSPAAKPKTEGRIVVFGSSQMITRTLYGFLGNGDMAMNSVAWLAERTEQIAINRPDIKRQPLSMDDQARKRIDWFAMPLLPCLVGLVGLFIHTLVKRH